MPPMQPSSYHRDHHSNAYDDLRLPPIRTSESSYSRPQAGSRHITTLEPPAHTSSSMYPRNASVTLPPLRNPERRPSSSMGHHSYAPAPLQHPSHSSRHTPAHPSHSSGPPPSYHRPSSSHHRTASLSINTPNHPAYPQSSPPNHRGEYHHDHEPATSPTSGSRAYMCDLCGATFSRAYDCKRHREIHTRQGGHECPYCHKALSRADALKRHMERGCVGMDDDDVDDIERERERREKRDKRHSVDGASASKYYYTSVNRHH